MIGVDDIVNAKWHYILSDEGHLPRPLLPQVRGQISNPEMKSLVPGGIPNTTFAHKIIFKQRRKYSNIFDWFSSFINLLLQETLSGELLLNFVISSLTILYF